MPWKFPRRHITVRECRYRWWVALQAKSQGMMDLVVVVQRVEKPRSQLKVCFGGYLDLMGDWAPLVVPAPPFAITPRVVGDCIRYALDAGWEPDKPKKDFIIADGTEFLPCI
jgi:hypothetical protein